MADVKIVDIDGSQWNMKDQVARDKIAELTESLIAQDLEDIEIDLGVDFTATFARLVQHYKVGKIHFAKVEIKNISGKGIGTVETANIGKVSLIPKKETGFLLFDYKNSAILRCYIDKDSSIRIGESKGVVQGNNICYGELIFAEA